MERFEFNLSNRKVRLWLVAVMPILIISMILYWVLPNEYAFVPAIIQGGTVLVYFFDYLENIEEASLVGSLLQFFRN